MSGGSAPQQISAAAAGRSALLPMAASERLAGPGQGALSATAEPGSGFQAQNAQIADKLYQAADILSAQGADPFRIAAYRGAADSVSACNDDLETIAAKGGRQALEAISGVGVAIAGAIAEMLATGRWAFLDHLNGTAEPEMLFQAVPGVGPALARRLCKALHIDTLEGLEAAAYDGRLEQVPGFGHRRAAMVRATLGNMLARVRRAPPIRSEEPSAD
jgi:putative hydrolase